MPRCRWLQKKCWTASPMPTRRTRPIFSILLRSTISSVSSWMTFQKTICRTRLQDSRIARYGASSIIFRKTLVWQSSTNWRSTTAVFLPTAWDWARHLQPYRSSNTTRTETRRCLCFVRRNLMTTGLPTRVITRIIR